MKSNFYFEVWQNLPTKPKGKYNDYLQKFYKIAIRYEPTPKAEAKLAFLAFLDSFLFTCECGAKFPTVQAKNGHKKKCKL